MIICGIDLGSRKTAVARLSQAPDGEASLSAVTLLVHPAHRGMELYALANYTAAACVNADMVYIEEPLVGRGVKASMALSQVAGTLMAKLAGEQIPCDLVNVKTWKSKVVGNGNADKKAIEMWLKENHPKYAAHCGDQDQFDAACIALFGRQILTAGSTGLFATEVSNP